MSGPKVVRVVTREERVATCEALLAQLDAAIRALEKTAKRHGDAEALNLATSSARREELAALLRQDAFDQVEQQAKQEIGFIAAKRAEAVERAATAVTTAREKGNRQRQAATTLLKELERKAPQAHAELAVELQRITKQSKPSDSADAVLQEALLALTPSSSVPAQLSDAQKALAKSLQALGDATPVGGWSAPAVQDKRILDLYRRLSQIEVLKDSDTTKSFNARLESIEQETEGPARSMKLDALVLDVASSVETLRREAALVDAARATLAQIDALGSSGELLAIRDALVSAVENPTEDLLTQRLAEASQAVDQVRLQRAAAARRDAILEGLASLGYQVNESMSTSWVDEGRVVLRKSDADLHGVEVASAPDAQRLQVRAVAFSAANTPASNLAAETTWCGDFSKLQDHLKQHSGELAIERALPVGAVPLKVVAAPPAVQVNSTTIRHLKTQQAR